MKLFSTIQQRAKSLIVITGMIASFTVYADNSVSQERWTDNAGTHHVTFTEVVSSNDPYTRSKYITVQQTTGGKQDWILRDYIEDCPLDFTIRFLPQSIEHRDLFASGTDVFLFAYRMGCFGGVDPLEVKYFAYYQGKKYALRGEEKIIMEKESYGGEKPPVADWNLRTNPTLLTYMQGRWPKLTTRNLADE